MLSFGHEARRTFDAERVPNSVLFLKKNLAVQEDDCPTWNLGALVQGGALYSLN
jgi:hypothetical protein